jgi:hypothetical protein
MTPAIEAAKAKARAYVEARGTNARLGAIRSGIADAFAALGTVLDGAPSAHVTRRPREGEWCVQEIADHLVETFRPGADELRCLLAGQRPPGAVIPASLQSKAPMLRPWPWLRRELVTLQTDVIDLLSTVPDAFVTDARVPLVMVVNVEDGPSGTTVEWIEELDWKAYAVVSFRLHTVDHLKQVRAVLAATAP